MSIYTHIIGTKKPTSQENCGRDDQKSLKKPKLLRLLVQDYWGQTFVQPLMLPILQVKVLSQELPIYLGSHIRLRRR